MENFYNEVEDLKEQIKELQQENHLLVTKNKFKMSQDLQIARLRDRLEFASEQADTFAKALKKIYDSLDKLIDRISYDEEGVIDSLTELKNSIPENALRRVE